MNAYQWTSRQKTVGSVYFIPPTFERLIKKGAITSHLMFVGGY
jgi:hypothetical protein